MAPCTHTLNTKCRCGPGRFCNPDQACELCKRCSRWASGRASAGAQVTFPTAFLWLKGCFRRRPCRCGQDEEAVRNCTATANTECKKVRSTSALPAGSWARLQSHNSRLLQQRSGFRASAADLSGLSTVVSSMALLLVLAIVLAIGLRVWKRRRGTGESEQNSLSHSPSGRLLTVQLPSAVA